MTDEPDELRDEEAAALMEAYVEVGILVEEEDDEGNRVLFLGPNAEFLAPQFYQAMTTLIDQEVNEVMDSLQEQGLIEEFGLDEDGEVLYGLTDFGSVIAGTLDEDELE